VKPARVRPCPICGRNKRVVKLGGWRYVHVSRMDSEKCKALAGRLARQLRLSSSAKISRRGFGMFMWYAGKRPVKQRGKKRR
jgi:hypothetical protein